MGNGKNGQREEWEMGGMEMKEWEMGRMGARKNGEWKEWEKMGNGKNGK